MKTVYTCFCTDVIHEGHLNIIHEAGKYGEVILGVLGDEAMIRFTRLCMTRLSENGIPITSSTGTTGWRVP